MEINQLWLKTPDIDLWPGSSHSFLQPILVRIIFCNSICIWWNLADRAVHLSSDVSLSHLFAELRSVVLANKRESYPQTHFRHNKFLLVIGWVKYRPVVCHLTAKIYGPMIGPAHTKLVPSYSILCSVFCETNRLHSFLQSISYLTETPPTFSVLYFHHPSSAHVQTTSTCTLSL